jgi:hypothetical protein
MADLASFEHEREVTEHGEKRRRINDHVDGADAVITRQYYWHVGSDREAKRKPTFVPTTTLKRPNP